MKKLFILINVLLFLRYRAYQSNIPLADCSVDTSGTFKFIQIEVRNKSNPNESKIIVRGSREHYYHNDIYRNFMDRLRANSKDLYNNYSFKVLGGGYITVNPYKVDIFGSSSRYGSCNNKLTKTLLRSCFPDSYKIESDSIY
jgi:hypothetical protein